MTGTLIGVRLQPGLLGIIDRWIAHQPEPHPSRPEAIRWILRDWAFDLGLGPAVSDEAKALSATESTSPGEGENVRRTARGEAEEAADEALAASPAPTEE